MLYLVNGINGQYKDDLRYGAYSGGIGCGLNPGLATRCTGSYKLAESYIDNRFDELLATTTDNNQYVRFVKTEGGTFTAAELLGVSSTVSVGLTLYDTDGSTVLQTVTETSTAGHGPLMHDAFGQGYGWMWTDNGGSGDMRKGTIPGSPSAVSTNWLWWGRLS